MSSEQGFSRPVLALLTGSIIAIAAWLRFGGVQMQLILDDEWHALNMVQNHDYAGIFSRFGTADHSIPLTLWFEFVSRHFQLTEMAMRWPSLLAGCVTVVLIPWLLRPWLGTSQRLLLMALLAISPLMVFFSRFARPYALLALLLSAAVILAWYWWSERRLGAGAAWVFCAVLAAWLNPLSMAIGFAPFAVFGCVGLVEGFRSRGWQGLWRLITPAIFAVAGVALLLGAPVMNDWASLTGKSGQDHADLDTLWAFASFFTGTGQAWVMALLCIAAVLGWLKLRRIDGVFAGYLLAVMLLALVTVVSTGAAWIHQAIVPARYLIGLLPLFLALVALGLVAVLDRYLQFLGPPQKTGFKGLILATLVVGLWQAGPLPHWNLRSSAFAHHAANYFDLRRERNPFISFLSGYQVDPFYARIAARHPNGEAVVVEAPWYFESSLNPLHLHQQVHGQSTRVGFVNGLCAPPLRGEVRHNAQGINLRNSVFVEDLPAAIEAPFYVVLRRQGLATESPHQMDYPACVSALRERLGEPLYRSETALVFSWPGVGGATTSH